MNFEKLEKLYFKGLNYEHNQIHLLTFITFLYKNYIYLSEIGFSNRNLNGSDINLIFKYIKKFKFLIKLNIFDNYSKNDFCNQYKSDIAIQKINDYCLYDLRNLQISKNKNDLFFPKIKIKDYLHEEIIKRLSNKYEKYFSYQKLFFNDIPLKKIYYSHFEKNFTFNDIRDKI